MTEHKDDDGRPDQDAEPTLNAPGEAGPTGTDDAGEPAGPPGEEAEDQDAEPTRNAPGDTGPAGSGGS